MMMVVVMAMVAETASVMETASVEATSVKSSSSSNVPCSVGHAVRVSLFPCATKRTI